MTAIKEISSCEVCGNSNLKTVLKLGDQPLCDDLKAMDDLGSGERYPIEVLFCDNCKTCHQRFQAQKEVLFGPKYHYRAQMTNDVLTGMRQLVESVRRETGPLRGQRVLDVGCNDGSLLVEFARYGAKTYGIDPTNAAGEARQHGIDAVWQDYLTPTVAEAFVTQYGHPDIITFTNVFAHIDNLPQLLESLKILKAPNTTIVIENHYLGAVLDKNQFDTFYHEHPRTYSYASFLHIAKSLGMHISNVEFPVRYGGNIRVFLQEGIDVKNIAGPDERGFGFRLLWLASRVETWKQNKSSELAILAEENGPLAAVAFPGRAAIAFSLLGLDESVIEAVYEKPGSKKIGHYVPGTTVPILSERSCKKWPPVIVNLAWHIPFEVETHWRSMGYEGPIVQMVDEDDFL